MNEVLTCVIVEDEVMAMKSLQRLCEKTDVLRMVGSFSTGEEAQVFLESTAVDLIFLDIEMPGMSGIDLLDSLSYLPQIIFTTNNQEYAYEAFEYDVTDFLKKPILPVRLARSIEKAVERNKQLNNIAIASKSAEIYVKSDKKYIRVPYDDIHYFENAGDYVKIITDTITHVVHGSLKSINNRLDHPRFFKVHRSFIVNLGRVKDIEEGSLIIGSKVIPISRSHRPLLMKSINIL